MCLVDMHDPFPVESDKAFSKLSLKTWDRKVVLISLQKNAIQYVEEKILSIFM